MNALYFDFGTFLFLFLFFGFVLMVCELIASGSLQVFVRLMRVSEMKSLFILAVLFKKPFELGYRITEKVVLINDVAQLSVFLWCFDFVSFGFIDDLLTVFFLLQLVLPVLDLIGLTLFHYLTFSNIIIKLYQIGCKVCSN